ncbi:MAG TPA: hypothetical protein VGM27_29745, partial [Acidobacteriaceae bacterium]
PVLCCPALHCSKRDPGLCGNDSQRSVMFKVWLKQPESMQSKIATRREDVTLFDFCAFLGV